MKAKSEIIWDEYYNDVRRFVLSKVKDEDNAKDILQEVFLKLHLKITSLKSDEKAKQWLFQIARNTMIDFFRKQKLSSDLMENDIPNEVTQKNSNEQFSSCVGPHINKLPLIYKEALVKTEFENYSQVKLAKELSLSYSTVKSRVQRAKELLKKYFKECCHISTDKYGNILSHHQKENCKFCN